MAASFEFRNTDNSTIYRRYVRRYYTSCDRCPPHGGENRKYRKFPIKKAFQVKGKAKKYLSRGQILHYPWND